MDLCGHSFRQFHIQITNNNVIQTDSILLIEVAITLCYLFKPINAKSERKIYLIEKNVGFVLMWQKIWLNHFPKKSSFDLQANANW